MTALTTAGTSLSIAPPPAANGTPLRTPFEQNAAQVLEALQTAARELLAAASGETRRVADVERTFGVDHRLAWQLHKIAHAPTPLAAGLNIPARVSIQKLLKAAARRRVPAPVLRSLSEAFDSYERLVQEHARDRAEFEALLGALLPEAQWKQEQAARQGVFKHLSQIKGVAIEAGISAHILRPSADGARVDCIGVNCDFGLRRLRPGAPVAFERLSPNAPDAAVQDLDGNAVNGPEGVILPQFCSRPTPRFEVVRAGNQARYWIPGSDVGLAAAIDLVVADCRPAAMRRYREPEARHAGAFFACDVPSKRMVLDVFVHRDLYEHAVPELAVYDTVPRGLCRVFHDPTRELDRLPTHETLHPLGRGLAAAAVSVVPMYTEILQHAFSRLALDPALMRGYRLDVEYPVYAAQYTVAFALPERPALEQ